jgi:hypothetical protein
MGAPSGTTRFVRRHPRFGKTAVSEASSPRLNHGKSGGQMNTEHSGNVRAFVQTAEQADGYVWVITLVDFAAQQVKRSLVSDERYTNRAAAHDAGQARLNAMASDA